MRFEKIKKLLRDKNINFKDKKVQAISGVVAGALIIAVAGTMILHNKSSENNNIAIEKNAEDIELDKNKELSEELVVENTTEDINGVENIEEHVHDENCNHDTESSTNELNETTTSSKVINENEENSIESSNNQRTTTDSNKTSSSNTSSSTSNQSTSKPSTSTSQHTHTWVEVYKDVYHKEEGHYETVTIKDAWTESIPVYEDQARSICNTCGKDITGNTTVHVKEHMLAGEANGGYRTEYIQVQVGTNTINHPAVTEQKWVVDKQAWTEKVLSGYKCNSCGATK